MDATPATQTEQLTLALYLWDRYIERPFIWHLRKSFDPGFLESYFTLKHIQLHGPRTMTQLAAALGKSRQRTTQVVNRMIAQGHVRRVPDLADRRVVRIVLTQKAEAALREVQGDTGFIEGVRDELSPEDFEEFNVTLQEVTSLLLKFEDLVQEDTGRLPDKKASALTPRA